MKNILNRIYTALFNYSPCKPVLAGKSVVVLFLVAGLMAACSPPETLTDDDPPVEEEEEVVEEPAYPDWYQPAVSSDADSLHFYGYAAAVAVDSIDAGNKSERAALQNLVFSIDEYTEEIRSELADEGHDRFDRPGFIIQLRNAVYRMQVENADVTTEYISQDGVSYRAFTRLQLPIEDAMELLTAEIDDDEFTRHLDR